MRIAKICICSVQCLLLLLILVPLAFALGQERALPDTATQPMAQSMTRGASPAPGPTIEDVWLQNGGARLNYSALYGARQQYMGGASRIDPACSPLLPPMRAWGAPEPKKKAPTRSRKVAANPCPEVNTDASTPGKAAVTASKSGTAPAGVKASAASRADTSTTAASRADTGKTAASRAAQGKTVVTGNKNGAGTAKPLNTTPRPDLPTEPKP